MKNDTKYFRNKFKMDEIAAGTLWLLEDDFYARSVDEKYNYWYDEVENPVELQVKQD